VNNKIFIFCYAFDPLSSEGRISYNIIKFLQKNHHIALVTRANNAKYAKDLGIEVYPIENSFFLRFKNKTYFSRIYHLIWHYTAANCILKSRPHEVKIAHHFNFHSLSCPPFIALLHKTGAKIVWGPINQNPNIPFLPLVKYALLHDICKSLLSYPLRKIFLKPYLLLASSPTLVDLTISGNAQIHHKLTELKRNSIYLPQVGCQASRNFANTSINKIISDRYSTPEKVLLSVGRLSGFGAHIKMTQAVLDSFIAFTMCNQTPYKFKLKVVLPNPHDQLKAQLYLSSFISPSLFTVVGYLDPQKMQEALVSSYYLLNFSFESAGLINVEALQASLPVICLQYTEASSLTFCDSKLLIHPSRLMQNRLMAESISDCINSFMLPEDYTNLCIKAKQKSVRYQWYSVASEITKAYNSLL